MLNSFFFKSITIRIFYLVFVLFCLSSGSLSAQSYSETLSNPTCTSCTDGRVDVNWTYGSVTLRVRLYDSSWNLIQTDNNAPYSFTNLGVGTYTVYYQYYKDWGRGRGWRDYATKSVSLTSTVVTVPFEQRTSQNTPTQKIYSVKGDFTMIGNTNLTLENYSNNGNNSGDMIYVDVDSDISTLNSSSATLDFSTENDAKPQCSNVVYAGLYWTGRSSTTNNSFTISKMGIDRRAVNVDFTVSNTDNIPYSDYSLDVWRGNTGYEYVVVYDFSASGQDDIRFLFYNNGSVYYRKGDGNYSNVVTSVNTSSGIMTASFEPITIFSEIGGIILTIDELKRGSNTNSNNNYYESTSEVSGNAGGFEKVETGVVTKTYDKKEIFIKHASESTYQKVVARTEDIYYPTGSESSIFAAYAEVTKYVQDYGIGEYFVADMALIEGDGGGTGYSGGWGLVVVYENSKMKWRDVTLFDGYAYVQHSGFGSTSYELPISGFEAVQSGDVNIKLGLMASEGDVNITGDFIQIQNAAQNNWTSLSHNDNSSNNFFNSSISTEGNVRNPNLVNNTGVDISMFNVPNSGNSNIANSQTSTMFRYGTTGDTYSIFALAMAVDAYVPEAEATNAVMTIDGNPIVDGSMVLPGQEVVYQLDIRNRGTEVVNSARLVLPIPYTTDYVNSSAAVSFSPATNNVYYDPSEGATGSIVWEIGNLPVSSGGPDQILGTLTYTVKVTEDCSILGNEYCNPSVAIGGGGGSSGTGATSGTTIAGFSIIQGYETSGECIGEPIVTPIEITIDAEDFVAANCTAEEINSDQEYFFCNLGPTGSIPITEVSANFPAGCRFYDSYPVVDGITVEFTASNEFLADVGTKTYYAVPPGYTTCYYAFKITVKNISSVPIVSDVNYCKDSAADVIQGTVSDSSYELFYYLTDTDDTPYVNFIPPTDSVGAITYYVAEGESSTCLSPNRVPVKVNVHPNPIPIGIYHE